MESKPLTRTFYGTVADDNESHPRSRDLASTVAVVSNTVSNILAIATVVVGLLVIASGGILCYQGVITLPPFNYVMFVFAGIDLIAGLYIIIRTFNLQSAINQLKTVNADLKVTEAGLRSEVSELNDTNAELTKTSADLTKTSAELRANVDKLRLAISAIVQANDSSIEVGALVKDILEDISREREKITSERMAAELFTTRLSEIVFAEMDMNRDGVVDRAEQNVWLSRVRQN